MNTRFLMSAVITVVALIGSSAGPADAAEGWAKTLDCGTNYRCYISTNTTAGATHYYNDVPRASWATSGNHSSSKDVNSDTMASASTPASFLSHSASCSCKPGYSCAV